jgi:hypothetical protein
MSRTSKYSLIIAMLLCAGLMFAGSQELLASKETKSQPVLTAADIAKLAAEASLTCEANDQSQSLESSDGDKMGPPCKDCPRKNGGQCTRISCEPCCYACVGQPLPVCSS